jgi:integrase
MGYFSFRSGKTLTFTANLRYKITILKLPRVSAEPHFGLFLSESGLFFSRRIVMKMTKSNIAALRPGTKPQLCWDANRDHPGLGILVGVKGTKTWILQAKVHGKGVTRRLSLGPVSTMTPEQAWERAVPLRRELDAGTDPKAKRHKPATVREALETYLATRRRRGQPLRERSRADYRGRVERLLTAWLEMPVAAITAEMAQARFLAISGEVEARRANGGSQGGVNVTGGATANGAMTIFRALWKDQKARDPAMALLADPTALLRGQWHELKPRKRRVSAEDLPRFYAAIQALPNRLYFDLLSLAIFTGWREGELTGLRWDEVDLKERMIHIPDARMKNHRDFDLPMSKQVADLLISRRALGRDGDFVFPGNGRTGHTTAMTVALGKVAEACGVRVSPHDLRRSFASVASTCRIHRHVEKMLVAHATDDEVHDAYVVLGDKEVRADVQIVADRIAELAGIEAPEGVERLGASA